MHSIIFLFPKGKYFLIMVKQESCADALESQSSFKPHQEIEHLLQPIIWSCRVKQKHNANKHGRFSQHYLALHKPKQLP